MSSDNIRMGVINRPILPFHSPSNEAGPSNPSKGKRKRRSSPSKRNRSDANTSRLEEDSRGNEGTKTRDTSVDFQTSSQPRSGVPGDQACNAGSVANAEVEKEEGLTEVEKLCRKKEKDYPDIVLKPEDTNAWPELWDTLAKHDVDRSKAHYQNMDTLLVLSGLFSAVVTTLLVEANSRLQQDPADATAQLLLQISMQLSSLSVTSGFINSTYIPPQPLPFSPAPSAVVISILWSLSLVISLVTASLGMLVKQWLREYHSKANVSPEQCCQIRMFRAPGLRKYKVAEIADFLPILLQIALILFFIGLILSYRSIHTSIANVVTIVIAIWLFFVVGTTFLPIISPSCPYKTPLLKSIFFELRGFLAQRWKWWQWQPSFDEYIYNPPDPLFIEEPTQVMDNETKSKVLMSAYETFQDIKSWDIVMRCVDLNSPLESLRMLTALVTQKHGSEITVNSVLWGLFNQAQLRLLLKTMAACLRRASFVALKGGRSAWFKPTEVAHFVTLQGLWPVFRSSGGSDAALHDIVNQLTEHKHALSVPHHPDFFCSYIVSQLGLSETRFPKVVVSSQMGIIIRCITGALDSGTGSGAGFKCSSSLPHLLEMCRVSFLCAGRATKDAYLQKSEFLLLTVRLAESLQSISYPERRVDPEDVFRAQCALDMAMRLHMKVPGFVDKSLFQALHVCSVKMFDLEVKDRAFVLGYHIRTRNNALSTGEVPGRVSRADWEEVLRGKKYVGFQILDDGDDRDDWHHEDLQSSCKERIGFLWAKFFTFLSFGYEERFLSILHEFELEPDTAISA